LKSILEANYRPRVISTEFNSNYPLNVTITQMDPKMLIGYASNKHRKRKENEGHSHKLSLNKFKFSGCIWGASASAWQTLMNIHGYTLVGRVSELDLFWIRNDILNSPTLSKSKTIIPNFEWFFGDYKPLYGYYKSLHKPVTDIRQIYSSLLDFNDYMNTNGDMLHARLHVLEVIKSLLSRPCFNKLNMENINRYIESLHNNNNIND
jgi:hypothetical protein